MTSSQRRVNGLLLASTFIFCLCSLYNLSTFWHATIDDAYITARYSQNLADGEGLTFSHGMAPVEGYSDPLWMLVLAAVSKILGPAAIIPAAKFIALACLAAICWLFLRASSKFVGNSWLLATVTTAGCLALPGISLWCTAGLETVPYALAVFAATLLAAIEGKEQWRFPGSATAIGLACLLRPEATMFLLVPIATKIFFGRTSGQRGTLPRVLIDCGVVALFAGLLLLFRFEYFHAFTPNTFLLKAGGSPLQVFHGLKYFLHTFLDPLLLLLMALAAYGCYLGWRRSPAVFASGVVILLQIFFVLWSGGDWMPLYRFLIPLIPALLFPVGFALRDSTERLSSRPVFAAVCALMAVVLIGHAAYDVSTGKAFARRLSEGLNTRIALGIWMRDHLSHDETVAYGDVGALPFFSRLRWIDFDGLITREIALLRYKSRRSPQAASPAIDDYVLSQHPDWLILVTESPNPESTPTDYAAEIEAKPEFKAKYTYVATLTAYRPGMISGYPNGRYLQVFSSESTSAALPLRNEIGCLDDAFAQRSDLTHLLKTCDAR